MTAHGSRSLYARARTLSSTALALTCFACGARTAVDFGAPVSGDPDGGTGLDAQGADVSEDDPRNDGPASDDSASDGPSRDGAGADGSAGDAEGLDDSSDGRVSDASQPDAGGAPPFDAGPIVAPRPMAPLSTATVTSHRPTLHWALSPGSDGALVDVCADRACTQPVVTFVASGVSGAPASALSPGVYYWRLRGMQGGTVGFQTSVTWEFEVGVGSAPVDTSWGTMVDVNGDGFADVVVGSPSDKTLAGSVQVYLGSGTGLSTTPTTLTAGTGPFPELGYSVASAGDVNGDGFADVIVGAPNGGGGAPGAAYLYLGGAGGLSTAPTEIAGPATHDYFGTSVSSAGDVNGDGYADVVISGPAAGLASGSAYLYVGGPNGLAASSASFSVSSSPSVASAGDVNGDGFGDFVIGDFSSSNANGTAAVYLGGPSGPGAPIVLSGPNVQYSFFAFSVSSAGDVNGDGYADILAGAPGLSPSVSVFLGGAQGPSTAPTTLADPSNSPITLGYPNNLEFGESVASAGDVNADGYSDVVVGAPIVAGESGVVYLYLGTPSGLSASPLPFRDAGWGQFGQVVAGAGDVDGDGYADVLVGLPVARSSEGVAYFYRGGPSGITRPPALLFGPSARANFGSSLASTAGETIVRPLWMLL